ncbi:MAG: phosphodiester glycosidase family protein [Cyanomargarita calcarea GSE-NOS-MK-12-04C]|jgi:hypothetical protein|uniref:Phosphodiester glycosidase family protein n=1 Tax=Cyanomargarita calcarea GSE-NOS-MK-12-04C TaxID=2839659 RepID=A0A951UQQ8_9CYAN|nr:phosphodiester glycosidase family protein [Cyanomargarita calcarea GSE-NOS-MK-12-04C]
MVKKSDLYKKEYCNAIANKSIHSFAKILLLSVIATVFSSTINSNTTYAQQSPPPVKPVPTLPPPLPGVSFWGNQIILNGRTLSGTWFQRRTTTNSFSTHLSDGALKQLIGVDLLNTPHPAKQPIQWFSSTAKPIVLTSLLASGYRYLDITNFVKTSRWQIQVSGNTLVISTGITKVTNIRQSKQLTTEQIEVDLDRSTPWQVSQGSAVKKTPVKLDDPDSLSPKLTTPANREWIITLDGIADPVLIQRYTPPPSPAPTPLPILKQLPIPTSVPEPPDPLITSVEQVNNQTIIRLSVPFGSAPQISTSPNPNRLTINIRPDALVQRDITWAQGLRWRSQYVGVGQERFPVVWLEINPRTVGLKLKPIVANLGTLVGSAPLIATAQRYLAVAAINGGYFNRNNRYPLGAIRENNQWLSGPILNRGAIAWNDSGQFYFGRLTLEETLITANNQRLPVLFLNSGYVQNGISRYTPTWGTTYIPITDNEIILVVQKNQIINQLPGGMANQIVIPIPADGYLITLRGNAATTASLLPPGSLIRIESKIPADFNRYPNIIGAGPLLLQNRQIVLDAKGEKFSDAFIAEKAIRSAICTTATGNLAIAAVHNRPGGAGPTLAEHAQLMQQMGCVNALNLDGGSSTSLYLGGQLLDRSPSTAARVHNGIGIFLQPRR